jgi:CBS domain containing-hemolysin-like protein
MTLDAWLPWVVAAASAAVHTLATLILTAYPARSFTLGLHPVEPVNGASELEPIRVLDTRARVVFIALQAATLMSGALGVAAGMLTDDGRTVGPLVFAGGIAIIARFILHSVASFAAHRYREQSRRLTMPVVWVVTTLAGVPGTAWLATKITGRTAGDETAGQEASEALQESLDLLEEAHIPAEASELQMIRGILRMDSVKVREIMRPRPDMVVAPAEAKPDDIMTLMTMGGHSKIPVYEGTLDTIVGVVYARDLLAARSTGEPDEGLVKKLARPAIHVPESQSLERLLREFQGHRTSIAIVVDEYGSVAGLVTVTDLIEEIVGELVDEFDVGEPEIEHVNERETLADAAVSVDTMNRMMGTSIQTQGFDTVGGLVLKELGKIPAEGDRVSVDGLVITVQSTVGRRIRRVRIEKAAPQPVPEGKAL